MNSYGHKLKKIALAICYLAGDTLPKDLRSRLLSYSVLLISICRDEKKFSTKEGIEDIKEIFATVQDLLDLSLVQNFIPTEHIHILSLAMHNYLDTLYVSESSNTTLSSYLTDLDLRENRAENHNQTERQNQTFTLDNEINLVQKTQSSKSSPEFFDNNPVFKTGIVLPGTHAQERDPAHTLVKVHGRNSTQTQGERKELIVSILRHSAANLRDLKLHFKDVTDKTIQRDLLELMREKKIIRLGEKRWAKYYIK